MQITADSLIAKSMTDNSSPTPGALIPLLGWRINGLVWLIYILELLSLFLALLILSFLLLLLL